MRIRALFFDVYGTLVDWRSAMARAALSAYGAEIGAQRAAAFADAWRQAYLDAIDRVRIGAEPWRPLDEVLAAILPVARMHAGLPPLDAARDAWLVSAWNRLDPWPDCVEGLSRLRRHFVLAPVSNASFAQMIEISRHAGFVWDAILGAQLARSFKTHPSVYRESAAALGLEPADCLMVAAHNADLEGARAVGLHTAFVLRPREFGPGQTTDLAAGPGCDFSAGNLLDLAETLTAALGPAAPFAGSAPEAD